MEHKTSCFCLWRNPRWRETDTGGIYSFDLKQNSRSHSWCLTLHPRPNTCSRWCYFLTDWRPSSNGSEQFSDHSVCKIILKPVTSSQHGCLQICWLPAQKNPTVWPGSLSQLRNTASNTSAGWQRYPTLRCEQRTEISIPQASHYP